MQSNSRSTSSNKPTIVHGWTGTSSCTVQQNGRANWRAFSLHTPRANKKQTWFPACIKKININLEGETLWVLSKVWKHLMIFFCVVTLHVHTATRTTKANWRLKWKKSEMSGPNAGDKYTSAIPKNLYLGCNSQHCSADHFLITNPSNEYANIK